MSLLCGHSVSGTGKGCPTSKPVWRYIKGSAEDFQGAPDWALYLARVKSCGKILEAWEGDNKRYCYTPNSQGLSTPLEKQCDGGFISWRWDNEVCIIAQRERVTSVNDDRLARDMGVEMVNHPSHYNQSEIECIDAMTAATVNKSGIEAICVSNVVKYLWRYEEKNGVEDVKKARWYLERLISELESK